MISSKSPKSLWYASTWTYVRLNSDPHPTPKPPAALEGCEVSKFRRLVLFVFSVSDSQAEDLPREPLIPLIKEYGLNYKGIHMMICAIFLN